MVSYIDIFTRNWLEFTLLISIITAYKSTMPRYYYSKKSTTDDYSQIWSIFSLKRDKVLKSWDYTFSGTSQWTRNGEPNGSISFTLTKDEYRGSVRVSFTQMSRSTGEKKKHDYTIQLESTPCHLWGRRWWFLCPCRWNRCSKLYLQSNGIFASRKTLNLSYESRNTSKFYRTLDAIFGKGSGEEQYQLWESIKYPYRNGRPTRKMRKYLKMTHSPYTLEQRHAMEIALMKR